MLNQIISNALAKALTLLEQGQGEAALRLLSEFLPIAHDHPNLHFFMALAYASCGDEASALQRLDATLKLYPSHVPALINKGEVLFRLGQPEGAVSLFDQAISLASESVAAHSARARVLASLGLYGLAALGYRRAIELDPSIADLWNSLGVCYAQQGCFSEALDAYSEAVRCDPKNIDFYNNLGNAHSDLNQVEKALSAYNSAIDCWTGAQEFQQAVSRVYANRGSLNLDQHRYEHAIQDFKTSLSLNPQQVEAYRSLGVLYAQLKQLDLAEQAYTHALEINHADAMSQWFYSMLLLMRGDYDRGWHMHEARSLCGFGGRVFSEPLWLGDFDLSDKTILLHYEQGFGDTIQFCRFVTQVSRLAERVLLLVQRPLVSLCRSLDGVDSVLSDDDDLPTFDCHCPLMSLPLALGANLQTIPSSTSYLRVDTERIDQWRSKLSNPKGLKVGLVWRGGEHQSQSEVRNLNARRSIPLKSFEGFDVSGVNFFSLQKGFDAEAELLEVNTTGWGGPRIQDLTTSFQDFSDTAALIENLDLVISVCTSVAHLAGALGKPVWLLNKYDSDWRWLIDKEDSPWYPSMRIFNQQKPGDWDGVLMTVREALITLVNNGERVRDE